MPEVVAPAVRRVATGWGVRQVFPVGIDRGFDGKLESGAALAVEGIDRGSGCDEEVDGW